MVRSKRNAIADMVDLGIRLAETTASTGCDQAEEKKSFSLQTSLRASYAELYCEQQHIAFKAAVKRLIIRVDLAGYEFAPGPRPHDPLKQASETVKLSTRREIKTEGSVSGGVKASIGFDAKPEGALNAGLEAKKSVTTSETMEKDKELTSRCVTAKPGDRWEVQDNENGVLDATYLTENDPLGTVLPKDRSNRRAVAATVEAFQRDLHIEVQQTAGVKKFIPKVLTPNKSKLAAIVFAKDLNAQLGQAYAGKVVLCVAEDENDE